MLTKRTVLPSRSQIVAMAMIPFIAPLLCVLFVIVMLLQGRPFLYRSERMRDADTPFTLFKIRTMRPASDGRERVLGGYNQNQVTSIGRFLRQTRLDELPQIFNVLRGDIKFIGPRPPLRIHVAACPDRYRHVLSVVPPGITGLATVMVHNREARLMSKCVSVAETEAVYLRQCLPVKLRLDLIYARRRSLGLDALILWRTLSRLRPGAKSSATQASTATLAAKQPVAVLELQSAA